MQTKHLTTHVIVYVTASRRDALHLCLAPFAVSSSTSNFISISRIMATSLAPTFEDLDDADPTMCSLPELRPQFFIPRLEEKPQNPIMDTLRLWKNRSRLQVDLVAQSYMLPPELQLLSEDVIKFEQAKRDQLESIWTRAVSRRHGSMVRRPTYARHLS